MYEFLALKSAWEVKNGIDPDRDYSTIETAEDFNDLYSRIDPELFNG